MKFGLLGFPKVGKTSLFNILTGAQVSVDKFSSGKSQTNVGVAKVVDPRVARLGEIFKPKKLTYAQFDFLDLQGCRKAKGSSLCRSARCATWMPSPTWSGPSR